MKIARIETFLFNLGTATKNLPFDKIALRPLNVEGGFVDLPTAPSIGIDSDVTRLRAKPCRDRGTRMGKGLRSYTEAFPYKHCAVGATRAGY